MEAELVLLDQYYLEYFIGKACDSCLFRSEHNEE